MTQQEQYAVLVRSGGSKLTFVSKFSAGRLLIAEALDVFEIGRFAREERLAGSVVPLLALEGVQSVVNSEHTRANNTMETACCRILSTPLLPLLGALPLRSKEAAPSEGVTGDAAPAGGYKQT